MSDPATKQQIERRRLWPWFAAALLLCLFAAVFSFWWPMYWANALKNKILKQGGDFRYEDASSRWKSIFGERFHPWYHEGFYITLPLEPNEEAFLSDFDLNRIVKLRRVEFLSLNSSRNSPSAIIALKNCTAIQQLTLAGNGGSIPTDWIRTLPDLQVIRLMHADISPDDWRNLMGSNAIFVVLLDCSTHAVPPKSSSVETLLLDGENLNRNLAEAISRLPLTRLGVYSCDCDDAFWTELSSHPTLGYLEVEDTLLTEHAVVAMSNIAKLARLKLHQSGTSHMSLNQQQIHSLGNLANLEHLELVHLDVPDDRCWASLAKLPKLTALVLSECKIGDSAMAELSKSGSLEWIRIENTNVGDVGLMHLEKLNTLKELHIWGSRITEGGRIDFTSARPDVELVVLEW